MRVALFCLVGLCLGCNQVLGIEAATLDAKVGSDTPKGCVLNSDCTSTEICIFRVCSPPCDRDRDCMGGLECLRTTKGTACVAPKDSACGAGAKLDCPASTGTTCIDNECRAPCDDGGADACLPGQACVNGGCRRNDASPDAGERPDGGGATIHEQSVLAPDAAGVADAGAGPMDAGGALADAGMPAPSCTAGEKRCEQALLETCRNDGQWDDGTPCAYVCIEGACTGSCLPGDHQCADAVFQHCNDQGAWEDEMTCPKVCTQTGCVDRCDVGARQCSGLDLLVCTNAGSFAHDKLCDYVCTAGACVGQCVPDDTTCMDPSTTKVCDSSGAWQPGASCDFVCSGNACAGECKPNAAQCVDPHQIKHCGADGMWGGAQGCGAQACMVDACVGMCSPGDNRCKPGSSVTRETCGNDGQWGSPSDCQNVCNAQTSQCDGVCQPTHTQCSDTGHLQSCGNDGQWGQAVACPFVCDSSTGDCGGECAPGTYVCMDTPPSSSTSRYCNAGTLELHQTCNYPSELCASGQCAANTVYDLGFASKLATSSSASANLLLGIPVTVSRRAALQSFGLYGRAKAGVKVKMALYDSDGTGAPRNFLSSSDEADLTEGVIHLPIQIAQTLNPGTYWVMAIYNGTGGNNYIASPGTGKTIYVSQDYLTPYPTLFPGSSATTLASYDLNLFLELRNSL